ncbi:MAG: hypothetical protein E7390_09735 [Ruminococcaceae bacterium]|nr:hypothetical protein [Oscillospiraceae bacterium]
MWYKCWENGKAQYVAFYNFGSETEEGRVPVEGGTFARQILGPEEECRMERGTFYATVPPRTLMVFRIREKAESGLYRNNILLSDISAGTATFYAGEGEVGAIYVEQSGKQELVALLYDGDAVELTDDAYCKLFLWDTGLRPLQRASE